MWRNDISRDNPSQPSNVFDVYDANYYVINEDYRVYICLYNNNTPENNFQGGPSLDQPLFTDLEPRSLLVQVVMVISGSICLLSHLLRAIKFDSTNYIPVPSDWETSSTNVALEIMYINQWTT